MTGPDEPTPHTVKGYGWKPDERDDRDLMFAAPQPVLAALPPKVDLREGCSPVYDQGHLGSCTANAIGAAFQFAQQKQGLTDLMPSRLFIYYNEREMEGTVGEDSGAMIRDGIKSVNKLGTCHEDTWKYDIGRFTEKPDDVSYTEALEHQATGYRRVAPDLPQMQGCLASGRPFVFGFSVYDSFESPEVASTGEVPMPGADEQLRGGHAVLAVGYDDSTQRFLVRNSWGDQWGDGGYFTMPYEYLTNPDLAQDFWAIYVVEEPPAA
jgi:C1A family cysteine protease